MADRFEECVTALLNGEVICHVSAPELFRFLDSDTSFNLGKTTTAEVVDEYLSKIGRGLAKTQDSQGYYCVYKNIDDNDKQKMAKERFTVVANQFDGLVNFFRLERGCKADPRPICCGDNVKLSDLLSAIENSETMQKQLTDIANSFGVGMTASKLQNTLNSVLKYLVKEKYLIQIGNVGSIYKATAKWSLLYDELEYIHSFDGFEIEKAQDDDDKGFQMELF